MDEEKVKKNQNIRRKLSRNKRKLEEPAKLSELEGLAQRKKKNKWSEKDRLREFRHDTKYSCIFICNCCHRRLFHENVEAITEKLVDDFNKAKDGLYRKCTDKNIQTPINGQRDCYICKTCISHLKARRMPPMSVKNKLKLEELDENMLLTDMEGSLIAKNLLFAKIYQLPKSRWTALLDKIINVQYPSLLELQRRRSSLGYPSREN